MIKKREIILKIVVFFIGFVIINSLISGIYLAIDSNSVLNRSHQQFKEYNSKLEYLFIGDSHIQDALDPNIIPNSFNYATIGENYILNYYKLKYVLEKENKVQDLKAIVLPVDLHSFSSFGLDKIRNISVWKRYVDFIELGKVKNQILFHTVQKWRGTLFPYELQGLTDSAKLLVNSRQETRILDKGFASNDFAFSQLDASARQFAAQQRAQTFHQNQKTLDESAVYYFQKILQTCLDHQIKVLLVRFPITPEYYTAAGNLFNIDEYYQKINSLIPQNQNIKIIDYHDYFFDKEEYLADPDHLNKKGANIISNLLKEELLKL